MRSKRKTNELAYAKSAKIAKMNKTEMPITNGTKEIPKKASKKPKKAASGGPEKSSSKKKVITLEKCP